MRNTLQHIFIIKQNVSILRVSLFSFMIGNTAFIGNAFDKQIRGVLIMASEQ